MKWESGEQQDSGALVQEDNRLFLGLPGPHQHVVVNAVYNAVAVGPFHSRTTHPVTTVAKESLTASQPQTIAGSVSRAGRDSFSTVLFLSANCNKDRLKLEKEQKRIDRVLSAARYQNLVRLVPVLDLDLTTFSRVMRKHSPSVLHFAGHGDPGGGLLMRDQNQQPYSMNPTGVAKLLKPYRDSLRLVVLNACHSDALAELLVADIDCVIGMDDEVGDEPAILFAETLYSSLADGTSAARAFEDAVATMEARYDIEADLPKLRSKHGVSPDRVFLVGSTR